MSRKTSVKNLTRIHEVMKKLAEEYKPNSTTTFQSLFNCFMNLTLRQYNSVRDFADQLTDLTEEKAALGKRFEISPVIIINTFMPGLELEYEYF